MSNKKSKLDELKVEIPYLRYHVDVDYSTERNCADYCDSICRCAKLHDVKVKDANYNDSMIVVSKKGATKRWSKLDMTELQHYAVDRIARIHKIYDTDNYEVSVANGYYGEEIGDVRFFNQDAMFKDILGIFQQKSDIELIKYLLKLEYSYVLPELEATTKVEIKTINFDTLTCARDYFMRVKRNEIADYTIIAGLPVGIVYNGRLIDGYHRVAKSIESSKKIKVIELS